MRLEFANEGVPARFLWRGCVADAKGLGRRSVDAPGFLVGAPRLGDGCFEQELAVDLGGGGVDLVGELALAFALFGAADVAGVLIGEGDADPGAEAAHGGQEADTLDLLHEAEHVAPLPAPETLEAAAHGIDVEARGLLVVEGAQALELLARSLEPDVGSDHVRDVGLLADALDSLIWDPRHDRIGTTRRVHRLHRSALNGRSRPEHGGTEPEDRYNRENRKGTRKWSFGQGRDRPVLTRLRRARASTVRAPAFGRHGATHGRSRSTLRATGSQGQREATRDARDLSRKFG